MRSYRLLSAIAALTLLAGGILPATPVLAVAAQALPTTITGPAIVEWGANGNCGIVKLDADTQLRAVAAEGTSWPFPSQEELNARWPNHLAEYMAKGGGCTPNTPPPGSKWVSMSTPLCAAPTPDLPDPETGVIVATWYWSVLHTWVADITPGWYIADLTVPSQIKRMEWYYGSAGMGEALTGQTIAAMTAGEAWCNVYQVFLPVVIR